MFMKQQNSKESWQHVFNLKTASTSYYTLGL